jgi:hypothetical protein
MFEGHLTSDTWNFMTSKNTKYLALLRANILDRIICAAKVRVLVCLFGGGVVAKVRAPLFMCCCVVAVWCVSDDHQNMGVSVCISLAGVWPAPKREPQIVCLLVGLFLFGGVSKPVKLELPKPSLPVAFVGGNQPNKQTKQKTNKQAQCNIAQYLSVLCICQ